jgi:thiol-disulfide isomerase/thioredoxin
MGGLLILATAFCVGVMLYFGMQSSSEWDVTPEEPSGSLTTTVLKPGTYGATSAECRVLRGGRPARTTVEAHKYRYLAIYYSAQWCGPCRRFTPKLVNFYRKQKALHPDFEIILVSSDRDEAAMLKYMKDYNMPWPAMLESANRSHPWNKFNSRGGIPCLVVLDHNGKVVADTNVKGKYLGPGQAMDKFATLLAASKKP